MDRRFSAGLSILAGYTWSKAITDTQGAETGAFVPDLQDNNNRRANRGLWGCRHSSSLYHLVPCYELPVRQPETVSVRWQWSAGKSSFWMAVRRHLHLPDRASRSRSTLPFDNPNVGDGAKLPNLLHNPNNGPKTIEKFFDTSAFAVPAPFTFGNESIGSVYGPSLQTWTYPWSKIPITERVNLQFRFEAFNALNHPILGAPNTTFGTPLFGQITGTRLDNRELQFALKLSF